MKILSLHNRWIENVYFDWTDLRRSWTCGWTHEGLLENRFWLVDRTSFIRDHTNCDLTGILSLLLIPTWRDRIQSGWLGHLYFFKQGVDIIIWTAFRSGWIGLKIKILDRRGFWSNQTWRRGMGDFFKFRGYQSKGSSMI